MKLNPEKIKLLMKENGLSQNKLSEKIGISKSMLSRCLNGKRGAGRKVITGLIKAFPNETLESLTIPEQNTKETDVKVTAAEDMPIKANPYSHQVNAYNFVGEKLGVFKEVVKNVSK